MVEGGIPKLNPKLVPRPGFSVGHFLHFCAISGVKIVPIAKIFACGALISLVVICKNNIEFFRNRGQILPMEEEFSSIFACFAF